MSFKALLACQKRLDFVFECEYILKKTKNELQTKSEKIGKLINYMMNNPKKFGVKNNN